jgi:hypothetical protein
MEEINFLDFDIHIDRTAAGYRVRVANSPAGQALQEFKTPFSETEVRIYLRVGRDPERGPPARDPEMEAARSAAGCLKRSLPASVADGCGRFAAAKQQEFWRGCLHDGCTKQAGLPCRNTLARPG